MAPNNALGRQTASRLRAEAEGEAPAASAKARGLSPGRKRRSAPSANGRESASDGFGAGLEGKSSVLSSAEVEKRGTGSAVRTPIEEFESRPRNELRCFFTGVMFLTRLPCPGWCDHHPGYLMRGMAYFPVLGALIGVWAAAFYDAAASIWPPLVAAAMSSGGTLWLTGCFHEDGLCDTLDGFGGGWTKAQIMKIMRDSRNGSYATMGGCLWVLAKAAAIAHLAEIGPAQGSTWLLGGSQGAGPAIIVAQAAARASSAVLIYFYDYVVDDEDAKGEYYNWFGDSKRLLGFARVLFSAASAGVVSCAVLPLHDACRVLMAALAVTCVAGAYGQSVLGGVMGDFLGATICMAELAIYLALGADVSRAMQSAGSLGWLAAVVSFPQVYASWRNRSNVGQEC